MKAEVEKLWLRKERVARMMQSRSEEGGESKASLEKGSLDHDIRDSIRVNVGSRSSVLEVTLALVGDRSRNSDRSSSVGDTGREGTDVSGLVSTSESEVVARKGEYQRVKGKERATEKTYSSP